MIEDDNPSRYVEKISHDGSLLALIVRSDYCKKGIEFFTSSDFSQQLGYMNRPTGHRIPPHKHTLQPRKVSYTNEVLIIKSGRVRVDLYGAQAEYVSSHTLMPGDVILLVSGGHGFKMLEPTEMIEVKQGPFVGEEDKVQIPEIEESKITVVS